jgi:transposase
MGSKSDQRHNTDTVVDDFELLANYLEPRFGNIYEYNLGETDIAGYDIQLWTDELRNAVKQYLLHDIPAAVAGWLFKHDNDEPADTASKEARVDAFVDRTQPWEVALAVHEAAVSAVPTLDQLIGDKTDWDAFGANHQEHVETWLDAHATAAQLNDLAEHTDHPEVDPVRPSYRPTPSGDDFVRHLTPPQLLQAWWYVVGPAPTDLTDAEWQLLVPLFGLRQVLEREQPRSWGDLDAKRRTFNAIRFKMAHGLQWQQLPKRYGKPTALYMNYYKYRTTGLFASLYRGLHGNQSAQRIVDWLEQLVQREASRSGRRNST